MKSVGGKPSESRIEIAILRKNTKIVKNKLVEVEIPGMMGNYEKGKIQYSNSHIANRKVTRNYNIKVKSTLKLSLPYYLKMFYAGKKIKKGTRFLVELSDSNMADSRIIGLYDKENIEEFEWSYKKLEKQVKKLIKQVKELQKRDQIIVRNGKTLERQHELELDWGEDPEDDDDNEDDDKADGTTENTEGGTAG